MQQAPFHLDHRLARDAHDITNLPLCNVRLFVGCLGEHYTLASRLAL